MKRLLALIVLAGMWTGAVAQQSGQTFTLEQAIQYALENSTMTKNSELDKQSAKARVKEITGMGLPQINGEASVVHNEKLQRFFTSVSSQGFFDFSQVPGVKEGDVVAAPNFFQLKTSGNASITANQLIFNGSYFVGLKAAKAFKDLSVKAADATNEEVVYQITVAYYNVLINKERAELFTSNIGRVDSLLRDTKALFTNGFAESIDVDRIQVQLNTLLTQRDAFLNLNKLGVELLKFQMNYPMDQPLDVTGSIQDLQVDSNVASAGEGWDYKNRPDYKVLEANKTLQQLNIRNLYAQSLPTLAAFGTIGYSTQSNGISGVFKTNTNIESGPDLGPDKWYNYGLFGVSLSVPLFSGFQQANKIKQQKNELMKIENNQQMLKSSIDLQVRQATIMFENSIKSLETQKASLDLATNVARVTKIKYEQGVGSNLEVIDAESMLKATQISYYDALFSAVIAKVDLDKAYGKLAIPAPVQK